ncbi:GbsR/MarR family transcriptional regulator [Actinophytocola sediminis]
MPGGRLVHEDRQQIASWLAEGLGYAEIARRLRRPTSTISREVARNGGPGAYRADQAHRATGQRARRHRPARQPATAPDSPDHQAVLDYVERFATLLVHIGLPRMAARVLASLVTTDSGTLTAGELVDRLRVSPASVSKAVAYLERLDLIGRERHDRREHYVIDDDVWLRTWLTSAHANDMLADTAKRGTEIFDQASPVGARLAHMSQFFAQLSKDMSGGPSEPEVADALTVLAALVHAGGPRAARDLAAALAWPTARVLASLHDAERLPGIAGPLAVRRVGDTYTVIASPRHLSPAQRAGLQLVGRPRPLGSAPRKPAY